MAKKPKTKKKVKPVVKPMKQVYCFICDGTGEMCNSCGEAEGTCDCGDYDFQECANCAGTGVSYVPKD